MTLPADQPRHDVEALRALHSLFGEIGVGLNETRVVSLTICAMFKCLQRAFRTLLAAGLPLVSASQGSALAQSIEPRVYSPAPVGAQFLVLAYSDSEGGLSVDPALPLTDVDLSVQSALLGYARSIDLLGKAGKIDVVVPYGKITGSALYRGEPIERRVDGFGDPLIRASVILDGAPAMNASEFRNYKQDSLVAVSLQGSLPVGQYDETRLINLGANRWAAKLEIGGSKRFGRWTMELAAATTMFGDNSEFFGGNRRSQAPIYSAQGHLIYNLPSGVWIAANATYFTGGETSLNGRPDRNLQSNWRGGLTAAVPVTRRFSIKANASTGISARTGNSFDLLGIAVQYRWGGGV